MVGVLVAAVEDRQHAMAELDEDERTLAAEPFSVELCVELLDRAERDRTRPRRA
jgi:hypothetical protein